MPSRHSLSVSLTAQLHGFVEVQVASGRFGTASEVVRAGLRLLERDLQGTTQVGVGKPDNAVNETGGPARPPPAS